MKIAYIITAYIDASQMRRLVNSLILDDSLGKADFYIHVDSKVEIAPFEAAMKDCMADVFWCRNRYRINWGGFNQVWSQYELLRMIFEETKREYDRVVCLSATDYPLWSNDKIVENYTRNRNVEYIGGFNLTRSKDSAQIRKIRDYHFFRDLPLPLKIKRAICGTSRFIFRHLPIHKPLSCVGEDGKVYDIYTGSDYWSLTFECAKYVFNVMKRDKKLMKYFMTSYIPSEAVVNTIVFNSRFKEHCSHTFECEMYPGLDKLTPLHHLQYKGAIKIYTIDDWNELMESDKMFFRKARTGISDTLIKKLETEIRK